ncbi:hypothetical protein FRC11_011659, partial [Ceratobasidium sp. 423]
MSPIQYVSPGEQWMQPQYLTQAEKGMSIPSELKPKLELKPKTEPELELEPEHQLKTQLLWIFLT